MVEGVSGKKVGWRLPFPGKVGKEIMKAIQWVQLTLIFLIFISVLGIGVIAYRAGEVLLDLLLLLRWIMILIGAGTV